MQSNAQVKRLCDLDDIWSSNLCYSCFFTTAADDSLRPTTKDVNNKQNAERPYWGTNEYFSMSLHVECEKNVSSQSYLLNGWRKSRVHTRALLQKNIF